MRILWDARNVDLSIGKQFFKIGERIHDCSITRGSRMWLRMWLRTWLRTCHAETRVNDETKRGTFLERAVISRAAGTLTVRREGVTRAFRARGNDPVARRSTRRPFHDAPPRNEELAAIGFPDYRRRCDRSSCPRAFPNPCIPSSVPWTSDESKNNRRKSRILASSSRWFSFSFEFRPRGDPRESGTVPQLTKRKGTGFHRSFPNRIHRVTGGESTSGCPLFVDPPLRTDDSRRSRREVCFSGEDASSVDTPARTVAT